MYKASSLLRGTNIGRTVSSRLDDKARRDPGQTPVLP